MEQKIFLWYWFNRCGPNVHYITRDRKQYYLKVRNIFNINSYFFFQFLLFNKTNSIQFQSIVY
jgi:hypothetical protein